MRKILNFFQAILIAIWTAFCGLLGMVLIVITWQRNAIMLFLAHYLWSPVICFVSGVKVRAHGLEHINKAEKAIYVANHSSLFDIVAVCRACPVPLFYIAKKELAKVPVMGQFMWLIGMIFIDRKNKDSAMRSMMKAAEGIKKGRNIISFPEGTRSKDGTVGLFKRGSFIIAKQYDIPVAPITIVGAHRILSAGSTGLHGGVIDVYFHPTVKTKDLEPNSEEDYAAKVRSIVVSKM